MEIIERFMYSIFIIFLLVLSIPIVVLVAVCIVIVSGWPILFRQKRVGKNGKTFTLYKFRTMMLGAEKVQQRYGKQNEANGPVFKIHNDPRFTPIGRFLSHTGLDEIPQLWNVAKGDMALIGPRPLPVEEADKLLPWMKKRDVLRPGIISPWIFEGYHNRTFTEWMKSDLAYTQQKSFWHDLALTERAVVLVVQLIGRELRGPSRAY